MIQLQPIEQGNPVAHATNTTALVLDNDSMRSMMTLAEFMAKGTAAIPKHLQNNPADCLAVVMQAMQWRMNPFAVAQKTHLVNGTLGYEGQLVNAAVTSLAPTKDRINYEWFGPWEKVIGKFREVESKTKKDDTGKPVVYRVPNWTLADEAGIGIRVWATMKGEEKPRVLELLLSQCRVRNSPLWADDPRQQIAYLAVKRWARLHCPDVILGVYTSDELEDASAPAERINPDPQRDLLPEFPEDRFQQALPSYRSGIESGRKTAEEVIAIVEMKWTMTEAQKKTLREIKPLNPSPSTTTTEQQGA